MGLRFYRRFRIAKGVRLNVSKRGASVSLGGRGAWFTIGRKGTRATVGLPGTGLSYTETSSTRRSQRHAGQRPAVRAGVLWFAVILGVIAYVIAHFSQQ
jgi:hypothetical protein